MYYSTHPSLTIAQLSIGGGNWTLMLSRPVLLKHGSPEVPGLKQPEIFTLAELARIYGSSSPRKSGDLRLGTIGLEDPTGYRKC